MNGASQEQEFGRDLGLMKELIVTGRKVGAGRGFYAALAHNKGLFWESLIRSGVRPEFRVEVDYAQGPEVFVLAFCQSQRMKIIKEHRGTLDADSFTSDVTDKLKSKKGITIGLFSWHNHQGGFKDIDEAIAIMAKEGFRPAAGVEVSALDEQFPVIAERVLVVGLGTLTRPDPLLDPYAYCLDSGKELKRHYFQRWQDRWGDVAQFAAVKKE